MLETKAGIKVECKIDGDAGELLGATRQEGDITIDFKECSVLGLDTFSLGDSSGIILLHTTFALCHLEKATKHVGIVVKLPAAGIHIISPETEELIELTGAVIGLLTPINEAKKNFVAKFEQTKGIQNHTKCEGGGEETLEFAIDEGEGESAGLATEDTITFTNNQELMA
jgi:hypothetical protein